MAKPIKSLEIALSYNLGFNKYIIIYLSNMLITNLIFKEEIIPVMVVWICGQ